MRFHVPQFIERESKLIGPLTLRQFLWFVGGGTLFAIANFFLNGTPMYIAGIIIIGLTAALAYLKVNEVPLPTYIGQAFVFMLMNKKYTFQKDDAQEAKNN